MLEKLFVGQRSGVSPVAGRVCCQKKSKVRDWSVSRKGSVATRGPVIVVWAQALASVVRASAATRECRRGESRRMMREEKGTTGSQRRMRTGSPSSQIRMRYESEVDLRTELIAAGVGRELVRLPEGRIRAAAAGVVVAEVGVVGDVEHVEREADARERPAKARQVLP